VKLIFNLFVLCIILTGCANDPIIDAALKDQSALVARDNSEDAVSKSLVVDDITCLEHRLDLSGNACNVLAWQSYMATLLFMNEQERQQALLASSDADIDHLKKMLLLTHTGELALVRKNNLTQLEQSVPNYPFPLDQLLLTYVTLNQSLLSQVNQLDEAVANLLTTQTELAAVKADLEKAQKKIDAITNIEQQLNSEDTVTHDSNN
jgi:hypothetical protein